MNDGPRGEFFGSAIGTLAGAVIGNVINSPSTVSTTSSSSTYDDSGSDSGYSRSNSYRSEGNSNNYTTSAYPDILIENVRFEDSNGNGILDPEETGAIAFDIINRGNYTVSDIYPQVKEVSGMSHIILSPAVRIEQIRSGEGIHYSTAIRSDKKLKSGTAVIKVNFAVGNGDYATAKTLYVSTRKASGGRY